MLVDPLVLLLALCCCPAGNLLADDQPGEQPIGIGIEDPHSEVKPEFERDILPFLKKSCLACHSANTADADVVLESPESMLAYDADGPLVVPGDPSAGKLLQVAAHVREPRMPPEENEAGAKPLTPAELGQLKRWIELGTKAGRPSAIRPAIQWHPVPPGHQPIMAAQITDRGSACICARGNVLEIYDLHRAEFADRLVDPAFSAFAAGFHGAAHLDVIRSLATRNDGEWIASGGFRTVKLWQRTYTSRTIEWPAADTATVLAVAAQGGWLATGDGGGTLSLGRLHPDDASPPTSWQGHESKVAALAFGSNGERLLSVGADGLVRCWEIPSRKPLGGWKVPTSPRLAEMINDEVLVTSSDDLVLRIWRINLSAVEDGMDANLQQDASEPAEGHSAEAAAEEQIPAVLEPQLLLRGHGREITALSNMPGAAPAFLSGSKDGFVCLWDVGAGVEKRKWIHGRAIEAVAASPDGSHIVSVGDDGIAKMWALEEDESQWSGAVDYPSSRQQARAEQTVEIAAGNVGVAKEALDAAHRQRETDQKKLTTAREKLAEAKEALADAREQLDQELQSLLAAAKKESAEATGHIDTLAKETEQARQKFTTAEDARQDAEAVIRRAEEGEHSSRGVVRQAKEVLIAAQQVLTDRRQACDQLREEELLREPVVSATFSNDGEQLLFANRLGRLFLFHVGGSPVGNWRTPRKPKVCFARFSASNELVTLGEGPEPKLLVWNPNGTWRLQQVIGAADDPESPLDGRVLALDFSPDGRWLAIGGGDAAQSGQVVIWNLAENRPHCELDRPHDDVVLGLAFSRDGHYLATSSADRMMKVFSAADGQWIRSFEGHTHHVLDVAWRADGLQLATCSADKTIKVWDFRSGAQIRTFAGAGKEITGLEFLGVGSQLVSTAGDGTVRIHNADDGKQTRSISTGARYLFCCATTEVGDVVVVGGADQVLRGYNSSDGTEQFSFPAVSESK